MQYLSWFRYGYEILVINQWRGVKIECAANSTCPFETGEDVIKNFGFDEDAIAFNAFMLLILGILYRFLAYFALLMRVRSSK